MWPPPMHPHPHHVGPPHPAQMMPYPPHHHHHHPGGPAGPPPIDYGPGPGPAPFPAANDRALPPWHRPGPAEQLNNESWKADSWRQQQRQFGPYSNHELYRQQYSQLPLSRPTARHHPYGPPMLPPPPQHGFGGELMSMQSFESPTKVAVPPEYAAQMDYERQLREQYEPRRGFHDFATAARGDNATADAGDRGDNRTATGGGGGLELRAEPSARRIKLSWVLPRLPDSDEPLSSANKFKQRLAVHVEELEGGNSRGVRANELGLILNKVLPIHVHRHEFNTLPGSKYRIELTVIDANNKHVASGQIEERATFSLEEMRVLMQKAVDFTGSLMHPFTYLYRCKPKIYWDYVVTETRAEMNVYEKDSNGQAASPINKAISGLFFSARLDPRGQIPSQSPFGDVRFTLPACMLLEPGLKLYFSDFYCNSKTHYVTVVVCPEGGPVDALCRERLLPLDPFNNPFLLFQATNSPNMPFAYSVNKNVWVEIYYTENVPLRWGQLHHIRAVGLGTSKVGGLPHNKSCRTCNLYPQGPQGSLVAHPPPEDVVPLSAEKAHAMVVEAQDAALVDDAEAEDSFADAEGMKQEAETVEEESGRTGKENQHVRLVTMREFRARLEQVERAIRADFPGANVAQADALGQHMFTPLTDRIGQFLATMDADLSGLNTLLIKAEVRKVEKGEEERQREKKRESAVKVEMVEDDGRREENGESTMKAEDDGRREENGECAIKAEDDGRGEEGRESTMKTEDDGRESAMKTEDNDESRRREEERENATKMESDEARRRREEEETLDQLELVDETFGDTVVVDEADMLRLLDGDGDADACATRQAADADAELALLLGDDDADADTTRQAGGIDADAARRDAEAILLGDGDADADTTRQTGGIDADAELTLLDETGADATRQAVELDADAERTLLADDADADTTQQADGIDADAAVDRASRIRRLSSTTAVASEESGAKRSRRESR